MTVELFDPDVIYAAPIGAHLTYRGGPLLTHAKLYGVFVDATGAGGQAFQYQQQMSGFLSWIAGSDVFSEMAEYNTGLGTHAGDAVLKLKGSAPPPPPGGDCNALFQAWLACYMAAVPPPVPHEHHHRASIRLHHRSKVVKPAAIQLTDGDIQKLLSDNINSGLIPTPDAETLFVMFFPSGVSVQYDSQNSSCQQFCGYHSAFTLNGSDVYYAVLPFPDCSGCTAGLSPLDALTSITTHEIAEAVNDPNPGMGWYDDTNGEIGDICAWQFRSDGGYNVQLLWSNQHNACI